MKIKASYHQERLWFLHQSESEDRREPGPVYHNIPFILEIDGALDIDLLEQSLGIVVNRHEALRTRIILVEDQLFQQVEPEIELKLEVKDLSGDSQGETHESLLEMAAAESKIPFPMDGKPLVRAVLIKISSLKSILVMTLHHLVSDRCSLDIIAAELVRCYRALKEGAAPDLPDVPLHYADFSQWQHELPQDFLESLLFYWKRQLTRLSPLELPISLRRAGVHTFREARAPLRLPEALSAKVREFCRQKKCGCDVLLLAAFKILLYRYCGQEDIVVGTSVDNRQQPDTESIVGPAANLLVIRSSISGTTLFNSYFDDLTQILEQVHENRDIPFERLAMELNPQKDISQTNFFNVLFQYREKSFQVPPVKNLEIKYIETNLGWGRYDLNLFISGDGESFSGVLVYNRDYYRESFISCFVEHYFVLLESILREPGGVDQSIARLDMLSPGERHRVLVLWNQTEAHCPVDKTIPQLFGAQVERAGDMVAVVSQGSMLLTYDELNKKSNQLARLLRKQGTAADSIVGLLVEPGIQMMIGMMGILKAGGAYLPIDPGLPVGRIEYILNDTAIPVLLSHTTAAGEVAFKGKWLNLDNQALFEDSRLNPLYECQPTHLAYVIYTSGSTGRPKGAAVEHCQLVNFLYHMYNRYDGDIGFSDRCLSLTNIMFDVSVWEFFLPLVFGAQLILLPKQQRADLFMLVEAILREKITLIYIPPALLKEVNEQLQKQRSRLRLNKMLVGVEPIRDEVLEDYIRLNPHMRIINGYGPTETTICASSYNYTSRPPEGEIVPIGVPLSNSQIVLLDAADHLVPQGIAGEICISGDGVSRGYINNPLLTAEKYTVHPYFKGKLMYRTGDLAFWLPDGNIKFLGRIDHQVKVRGYRIELGEIESWLLKYQKVRKAVVLVREEETGDKYICAYLVSAETLLLDDIKQYMEQHLPGYMVPSYLMQVPGIPLTPNGKVDRKALPDPRTAQAQKERIPPRNPVERTLAGIWAEVLGLEKEIIGINDDFFELGGHSLKATAMIAKVHRQLDVKLPLEELFEAPKLSELADYITGLKQDKYAAIEPAETKEYYLLSPAQKRMYIIMEMVPGSTTYNMPQTVPLDSWKEGEAGRLQETLEKLVDRHESLRTSFQVIDGEPVQKIHETVDFSVNFYRAADAGETEAVLEDFIKPFDLACAPLWRIGVLQVGTGQHLLLTDMHHIISDGVSNEIMIRDFAALYDEQRLPELRIQYKDFAQWLHRPEIMQAIKQQENYWLKEFEEEIPLLNLPIDYTRPAVQSFEGRCLEFEVSARHTRALEAMASGQGATLFMVLLAMINVLLSKLSGQEDIIIGSPLAGRRDVDLQKIIGMFINTLALRNYPASEKTFEQFLKEIKENTLKAFDNQEYPFEDLVEKVDVNRDASRNPLFDVMFALQTFFGQDLMVTDQDQATFEDRNAKFDLTIIAAPAAGEKLWVLFQYCTKLFKKESIERFITYFKKIISTVVEQPGIKLGQIEVISEEEKQEILYDFNDLGQQYPLDKTIHQLFEERVGKTADGIAVIGSEHRAGSTGASEVPDSLLCALTYSKLNEISNRLAHVLIEKGVKENHLVGLLADRSIEMIVGMLGILKAGGAYVPLNPKAPASRNEFILEECRAGILVSATDKVGRVSERRETIEIIGPIGPIKNQLPPHDPTHLCYVIFTSGSTGNPKGVPITHGNLSPLLHWGYRLLGLGPRHRVIQNLSYYFDWSVWEIFITLTTGAGLVITSEDVLLNPPLCAAFMDKQDIAALHVTPSQYQYLVQTGHPLETLDYLLIGAEKLSLDLVRRSFRMVKQGCRVFNMYGPTECTIITSTLEMYADDLDKYEPLASVPIGPPSANAKYFILDKYLKPCPLMVAGELYIAGDGAARGYLNNPELTAGSFNRSYRPYRSYKTGDLARWLPEGTVEFLGRMDHQVKIRGYRIELGEIESCILKHQGVREAVVLVKGEETGDKYICAYIIPGKEFSADDLKQTLSKSLPDYMIPSYFVPIETIPLTPNGKIDRKALPAPVISREGAVSGPRDEIEAKLVEIWSEVLEIEEDSIGVDANFFQLGGHSLKATVMLAKIHKELEIKMPLVEIFTSPTVQELAECIKGLTGEQFAAIEPVEKRDYYVLSSAQKRTFIFQQMEPESTAYNMPQIIPLPGNVDIEKLQGVFIRLIERHDSFRTFFAMVDEEPVQRIHDRVDFEITPAQTLRDFVKPFDLSHAPLLRAGLVKSTGNQQLLVVDMHHVISDGVSHEILGREVAALERGETLPPLTVQYKDFAVWQNSESQREAVKQQEAFWLEVFEGELPLLDLPCDYPRPPVQSFDGGIAAFEISAHNTAALKTMALDSDATLYMLLLTIFTILLSKLSGQEDIIIGTPIAGRRHADLEKIIGMFVNTLALRSYPNGEKSIKAFLDEVKEHTLEAFENQDSPFEELVETLDVPRDAARNPLFDVMFALRELEPGQDPGNVEQDSFQDQDVMAISKFDLTLGVAVGKTLYCSFEYCTKLFKKETIDRFTRYFERIITAVITDKEQTIAEIEIISPEERKQVLDEFNSSRQEVPQDKTLHRLFEEQVARTPDNIAVVSEGSQLSHRTYRTYLTYDRLNKKSNQLAQLLREKGLRPGGIAAVFTEPSIEMVAALMAVLKAGGAYLPLDPKYPEERNKFMLEDIGVEMLLSQADLHSIAAENIINLDDKNLYTGESVDLNIDNNPGNPAYAMYTSGSTGKPKGVLIEHRSAVNVLCWFGKTFNLGTGTHVLQLTDFTFDPSVEDIFGSLMHGAVLYVVDIGLVSDPYDFCLFVDKHQVHIINFVPTMLEQLLVHEHKLESLRFVISGGERLEESVKDRIIQRGYRLYNNYGPVETTVDALAGECSAAKVSLGKPVANVKCYILDRCGSPVPVGITGELCIAGPGVSRGYLNNPELTAERFHRSYRSYRSYKTGDLARWLPDGTVEFLGRIDQQIKIRGHRIELEEIENRLLTYQNLREAVVLVRENETGEKYICAYFTAGQELSTEKINRYLAKHLPDHMIPTYLMQIEKIPLTPNGKIHRKALPLPEVKIEGQYKAPRDEVETILVDIWSEILGIDRDIISIDAGFFQLGGHSLKATALVSKIRNQLNAVVPLIEVFKEPTIESLARCVRTAGIAATAAADEHVVLLKPGSENDPHLFLVHDGSGEVEGYMEFCETLTQPFNCWGLRADRDENLAPRNHTVEEIAGEYIKRIREIQPDGPYRLLGWSLGGTIAFEIVVQLEKMGVETAFLGLIDAPGPGVTAGEETGEFTLESELEWLWDYLPDKKIKEKVKKAGDISDIWPIIAAHLQENNFSVELLKQLIPADLAQTIPNYDRLGIRELIAYLNVGRTLANARASYIPAKKIHTTLHYLKASLSPGIILDSWKNYCIRPIKSYVIPGDHFSILKKPGVDQTVNIFETDNII